jgi:hypothetical protein
MRAIAVTGLSHVLVAYMILVWPVLVRRRYQTLKGGLQEHDPNARMRAYRRMLLHQSAMVLVGWQSLPWVRFQHPESGSWRSLAGLYRETCCCPFWAQ